MRWLGTAIALVVTAAAASARAQPAPKGGAAPAKEEEADAPDADGYGGTGWLDRVSKGTEEIEQCRPRSGTDDKELKRRKSDHYDRGVVLYEQGDYQGAIREFVTAYCDSPESSMFGSNYKDVYAFIVLILVLVFRHKGLLGERVGDRA